MRSFRLHWPAIVTAMIASFLFEAAWYSYFMNAWLTGIGRTMEWLVATGMSPAIQYGTALLCAFITAAVLSLAIQASGQQTVIRGIIVGLAIGVGFIATSFATQYIFEVRSLRLYAITTLFSLLDLMLMGAIVGGWKGKALSTEIPVE